MDHSKLNNKLKPSVYGVGFIGEGEYLTSIKQKHTKIYKVWSGMLRRCYSEKALRLQPSYRGCTVCEQWYNFQNFAKWFKENYCEGYQFDKDILIKGNKIYSPETCCFVPARINSLIINRRLNRGDLPIGVYYVNGKYRSSCSNGGRSQKFIGNFDTPELAFKAYKKYKENLIERVAFEYFKDDLITKEVYNSLSNWDIKITD